MCLRTHYDVNLYFYNLISADNSVGAIKDFCASLNQSVDALESFSNWYQGIFGDFLKPNYSYQNNLKTFRITTHWHPSAYFFCTQFGTNRHITSPVGFEYVFPNVITEQYHDQWCTDRFGAK